MEDIRKQPAGRPTLLAEYEVGDEQVTFIKVEETYEAAINESKKIIKGERRADDVGRTPQPE